MKNEYSIDGYISENSSFFESDDSINSKETEENLSKFRALSNSFNRMELIFSWLTVIAFLVAYLGCYYSGIQYASLPHARILYSIFVFFNVAAALTSLFAWSKIPSRSVPKDAILFFSLSMLCAAIGNSLDFIFWLTEITAFKQSVFTNLFFIFAILFSLPGVHLLGRVCRVEFSKQPFFYYMVIIFIYMLIPILMNSSSVPDFNNLSNLKEFIFGMLYAVGIGYLAAVSIHLWRAAQGRLIFPARLISIGLISMSFGCAIYAGLFPRIPAEQIPSSPVHIIIALSYVFCACGIKRTESTINTILNLKDTKLPPWLTLVELFGKNEGLEVYKRLETRIKGTLLELMKAKQESQQQQDAIGELEQEIALRKKTERDLISAKEKAEKANRAKSQFLAMMSHELKTPLTAIMGYGELLQGPASSSLIASNKLEMVSKQIVRNSDNLHGMIDRILSFSQLESGHFAFRNEVFQLDEVLPHIRSIANEQRCPQSINYREIIPELKLKFETDKQALQHIVVNLIVNAFKFCKEGEIILEMRKSGENDLFIAVQDSGVGIHSEHLEKIFDAFYQVSHGTKRKFGGTGLGLSIVKKITTEMKGQISVESQLGKGTRFEVFLPGIIFKEPNDE